MKTIDLVLKTKWYDMISSGERTEEYLEIRRWKNRLLCQPSFGCGIRQVCRQVREGKAICERFTNVRFRRGFSSESMIFEIEGITIGKGNPKWGAPKNKDVFIIKLGSKFNPSED